MKKRMYIDRMVKVLRGSLPIEHTIARVGGEKFQNLKSIQAPIASVDNWKQAIESIEKNSLGIFVNDSSKFEEIVDGLTYADQLQLLKKSGLIDFRVPIIIEIKLEHAVPTYFQVIELCKKGAAPIFLNIDDIDNINLAIWSINCAKLAIDVCNITAPIGISFSTESKIFDYHLKQISQYSVYVDILCLKMDKFDSKIVEKFLEACEGQDCILVCQIKNYEYSEMLKGFNFIIKPMSDTEVTIAPPLAELLTSAIGMDTIL